MDNYRRPKPPKPNDAKSAVDGIVSSKTQPYRRAALQQAEQSPRPAAQNPVQRPKAGIDMSLPEGESYNRHHMRPVIRGKARDARTMMLRSAFIIIAVLVGLGSILISQGYLNVQKVFKGTANTAASLQKDVNPNLLKGEGDGRINVLLVGIGGQGHAGGDLTDTIMVASIDPVNNTAALLSVPRDMWVTVPGKGSMKINAVYATAKYNYMAKNKVDGKDSKAIASGFNSLDQMLEKVLGVPINYNAMVNFQAFRQAVDTVQGVNVAVPEDLYDPTMAWENEHNAYLARAGNQTFDGKHALIYVRSRETSSDFARSQRQRAVILALKQKVVSLGVIANPTKISGLMNTFGSNVYTDLSLNDASRLYTIFKRISNTNVASVSLAGTTSITSSAAGEDSLITTGNINGQSIVMPKAGLENYAAIQDFVHSRLHDGYITKEKAKVKVLNGSVERGLGETMATKLRSYGYTVTSVGNAPSTGYPSTVVVDRNGGKKKYTKHYLEQRFNTTAVTKLPDETIAPGNADFIVILGSDASS